jgi:hypothetical protein
VAANRASLFTIATLSSLFVAAVSGINWAQNQLDVSFHAFQDSRGVTVLSPDADFTRDYTDRTTLKVKFGVDAISAASDSCARCHPDGANNGRFVGGASVIRKYGDTKLTLGTEFSRELFYTATTGLASVSRDLHQGNTTVAGGFSFSLNRPQLHPSDQTESQHAVDTYASVTQSWTKSTVTQFGYELNQINGYQTSPFLRTKVNGVMTVGNSPDARTRHALSARLRQALPGNTFVEADYRRYHDTWSIDSNALSIGLSHHFSPTLVGSGSYRRYTQTGAYFYAPEYVGAPQYFTGDFRLFPFDSNMFTGRVEITPKNGLMNMPPGTALTLQYERYRATTGFEAGVFTGGVRIPLK